MREVDVTATLDAPRRELEKRLSPRSIVEYAGTFEVESVEERDDVTVVTAGADQLGIVLEFTEIENGYEYSQQGASGPFEEMHTWVTLEDATDSVDPDEAFPIPGLEDDERTLIRVRSVFTFGGRFARLKDWFASSDRRTELERLIGSLVDDLAEADERESIQSGDRDGDSGAPEADESEVLSPDSKEELKDDESDVPKHDESDVLKHDESDVPKHDESDDLPLDECTGETDSHRRTSDPL